MDPLNSTDRNLVLISIDGLRAADLANEHLALPHLRRLAVRGTTILHLEPSFPSVTWCCHTTMVTGVHPKKHGVLGNRVLNRETGQVLEHFGDRSFTKEESVLAPTLYDLAHAHGMQSAALCWPKTRGAANIAWNIPEFYEQHLFDDHCTPEFWAELKALGLPVDRYGDWSAQHPLGQMQDWLTAEIALHLIRNHQPRLLMAHFLCADSLQHDHGSGSPEAHWAFNYVDSQIGRIIEALEATGQHERTNVIVLGDHGFAPVQKLILPNVVLKREGLIAVEGHEGIVGKRAWSVGNGGAAFLYVLDEAKKEELLPFLYYQFSRVEGIDRVITPGEFEGLGLPLPADNSHQPDLILHAASGYGFADIHEGPLVVAPSRIRGAHGYLASTEGLLTSLVAAGPDIARGVVIPAAHAIDVAPTAATLLGLTIPNADGRVLSDLIATERGVPVGQRTTS